MSINLIGLLASSGLPVFTRRANINSVATVYCDEELSDGIDLNTITTLYGLDLFSRLNDCNLQLATSERSEIQWTLCGKNLLLIAVASGTDLPNSNDLKNLLELTFDSITMKCGLKDVTELNGESLKRSIKASFDLIDHFITSVASSGICHLESITKSINYVLTVRSSYVSSLANSIAQSASSSYCALFVHRKLLTASKDWWSRLSPTKDAFLIASLLNSTPDTELCATKEVLIYLPCISPNNLSRLVISKISDGVVLCLLCTEYPSLEYIESEILSPLKSSNPVDEKFAKHVHELIGTKYSSPNVNCQSNLADILGKHYSVLNDISAFLLVHVEYNVHIIYNEDLIEQFTEEIVTLCQFEQREEEQQPTSCESYLMHGHTNMYGIAHKSIRGCVLFEWHHSVQKMNMIAHTLVDALAKAKHLWP